MSKQILIELVGENETGYCYADLYLPASAEEIAEAKERANWNSDSNGIRDISIEHCSTLPKLASFRLDSPTLDELNFLAQRLDAMDGGERTIMNGVLQYLCSEKGFADELVSMTDLINMTYGLDGVMIASNVGTDRQLGQFVIDNELNEDVNAIPETSLYLLDLERIGRLQRDVDGGVFVGNCYVVAGAFEMPHVYDGIHLPGAEPPACEQQGIRHISEQELRAMAGQEGLVLQGCGGDLKEYLRGMSTAEIAKDLSDRGVPTKNGKEKWKSSKISYMLSNERYIGDCCYQKTYRGTTVPFKQSKNRGEEDMYYATGTHAPIVEKDLFEKVQVLLKKRKEQFTKATTQNIYPLSSRIRCSECGSFYRRKVRSGGVKWVCARHEEDFKACNSNYYSEERRRGTHVACGEQPSGHRYS